MSEGVSIKTIGTTYATASLAPSSNLDTRITPVKPAPSVTRDFDDHRRGFKRWFLGPMPEKIVKTEVKKRKSLWMEKAKDRLPRRLPTMDTLKRSNSDSAVRRGKQPERKPTVEDESETDTSSESDSDCEQVDSERVYTYYIRTGGDEEAWSPKLERSMRREIRKKWRESGWYNAWRGDKDALRADADRKWVGKSFVIGDVLGVGENVILSTPGLSMAPSSAAASTAGRPSLRIEAASSTRPSSSMRSPRISTDSGHLAVPNGSGSSTHNTSEEFTTAHPSTSTTALLHTPNFRDRPDISDRRAASATPALQTSPVDDPKAPSLADAGRAFTAGSDGHDPLAPTSGLRSALKKAAETKQEGKRKSVNFDDMTPVPPAEVLARTEPNVQGSSAGSSGGQPPVQAQEETRQQDDEGLPHGLKLKDIFMSDRMLVRISYAEAGTPHPYDEVAAKKTKNPIFEDWAEYLVCYRGHHIELYEDYIVRNLRIRRDLGGEVPSFVEVQCPELGTRVRLDVPESEDGDGCKVMNRKEIVEACRESLERLRSWDNLYADEIRKGRRLELCWRAGPNVEWIWRDEDVDGQKRDWNVLYYVGFRQPQQVSHLELRLTRHSPTELHLRDGTQLREPPAVEGYLWRIKPKSQTRTLVYVSTHDGNIFTMTPAHSYPPSPPEPPVSLNSNTEDESRLDQELRRGAHQMLTCEGYIDMRSIRAIRRAKHDAVPVAVTPLGSAGGNIPGTNDSKRHDEFEIMDDENQTPSDAEDVGGEAAMSTSTEKTKLRLKRSFELILRNGHAVRFEAHSAMVALEWIGKLRALCGYWSRRHLVDAEEEMRLIETVRGVVTPKHKHAGADEISDPPRIGDFWNWCVLEGCRPIIKAGRLYEKKGLHKLYKHMLVILTHGHLILFHLKETKSAHHHRSRSINLIDSYTYSGQLAVATLPKEDTSAEPTARRYQDGLEANDTDEDVTFIIW
ncbi:hypothetical protein FRC05_006017 [Tulasnella sp. 425]|nr:hypothetical protein FRC05_006017 [Tulasnella sp. 425]